MIYPIYPVYEFDALTRTVWFSVEYGAYEYIELGSY